MGNRCVFVSLFLSIFCFAGDQFTLKKGAVDKIKLGEDINSVSKVYDSKLIKKAKRFSEGDSYQTIEIYSSAKERESRTPLFVVEEDDGKIWRVEIKSAKYKTAKGIGIGSTLGEIKKHYKFELLEGAEMGPMFASVDEIGMSFALDNSAKNSKETTESAKVIFILVR